MDLEEYLALTGQRGGSSAPAPPASQPFQFAVPTEPVVTDQPSTAKEIGKGLISGYTGELSDLGMHQLLNSTALDPYRDPTTQKTTWPYSLGYLAGTAVGLPQHATAAAIGMMPRLLPSVALWKRAAAANALVGGALSGISAAGQGQDPIEGALTGAGIGGLIGGGAAKYAPGINKKLPFPLVPEYHETPPTPGGRTLLDRVLGRNKPPPQMNDPNLATAYQQALGTPPPTAAPPESMGEVYNRVFGITPPTDAEAFRGPLQPNAGLTLEEMWVPAEATSAAVPGTTEVIGDAKSKILGGILNNLQAQSPTHDFSKPMAVAERYFDALMNGLDSKSPEGKALLKEMNAPFNKVFKDEIDKSVKANAEHLSLVASGKLKAPPIAATTTRFPPPTPYPDPYPPSMPKSLGDAFAEYQANEAAKAQQLQTANALFQPPPEMPLPQQVQGPVYPALAQGVAQYKQSAAQQAHQQLVKQAEQGYQNRVMRDLFRPPPPPMPVPEPLAPVAAETTALPVPPVVEPPLPEVSTPPPMMPEPTPSTAVEPMPSPDVTEAMPLLSTEEAPPPQFVRPSERTLTPKERDYYDQLGKKLVMSLDNLKESLDLTKRGEITADDFVQRLKNEEATGANKDLLAAKMDRYQQVVNTPSIFRHLPESAQNYITKHLKLFRQAEEMFPPEAADLYRQQQAEQEVGALMEKYATLGEGKPPEEQAQAQAVALAQELKKKLDFKHKGGTPPVAEEAMDPDFAPGGKYEGLSEVKRQAGFAGGKIGAEVASQLALRINFLVGQDKARRILNYVGQAAGRFSQRDAKAAMLSTAGLLPFAFAPTQSADAQLQTPAQEDLKLQTVIAQNRRKFNDDPDAVYLNVKLQYPGVTQAEIRQQLGKGAPGGPRITHLPPVGRHLLASDSEAF